MKCKRPTIRNQTDMKTYKIQDNNVNQNHFDLPFGRWLRITIPLSNSRCSNVGRVLCAFDCVWHRFSPLTSDGRVVDDDFGRITPSDDVDASVLSIVRRLFAEEHIIPKIKKSESFLCVRFGAQNCLTIYCEHYMERLFNMNSRHHFGLSGIAE